MEDYRESFKHDNIDIFTDFNTDIATNLRKDKITPQQPS